MNVFKTQRAFTLIELLVVITVIGILVGFSTVLLKSAGPTQKIRDAKRKADIIKVYVALEFYHDDNGEYPVDPVASSWGLIETKLSSLDPDYISPLPLDPDPDGNFGTNICVPGARGYFYKLIDDTHFELIALLEGDEPEVDSENYCGDRSAAYYDCEALETVPLTCYLLKN